MAVLFKLIQATRLPGTTRWTIRLANDAGDAITITTDNPEILATLGAGGVFRVSIERET